MAIRMKLTGLLIFALILAGCLSTQNTRQIELYTSELDPRLGQDVDDILSMVTDLWKFRLQSRWERVDPTTAMVHERNHHKARFSKKEAEEIFREKGYYNVLVFAKKGSEDTTVEPHFGDDEMMYGYHEHVYTSAHYIYIRFVFRDRKLLNYRFFQAQVTD